MIIIIKSTSSINKLNDDALCFVLIWFTSSLDLCEPIRKTTEQKQQQQQYVSLFGRSWQELICSNIVFRFIDKITRMTRVVCGVQLRLYELSAQPKWQSHWNWVSQLELRQIYVDLSSDSDKDHWHDVT